LATDNWNGSLHVKRSLKVCNVSSKNNCEKLVGWKTVHRAGLKGWQGRQSALHPRGHRASKIGAYTAEKIINELLHNKISMCIARIDQKLQKQQSYIHLYS